LLIGMPKSLNISVSMVIYNTTILYVSLPVPTSGTGIFSTDLIPSSHTMVPRSNPQISQINNTWKKLQKSKEELTSFFAETILILDQEIADGFLSDFEKNLILDLLQKSMFRVSYSNKDLCQEVYNMTEPVLKLRTDEIFEVIHENDALKRTIKQQQGKIADRDAELAEYKRIYGELKPTSHN